jgi:hypothetical protein
MDLESEETDIHVEIPPCSHENCDTCSQWLGYPQSHFPNWTPDQVMRCKIAPAIKERQHNCSIFHVDVREEQGKFVKKSESPNDEFRLRQENQRDLWEWLKISVSA